ncbi:MAG TPA: peptidase S10 [Bryobacteraceae bacterium]|nr:peptidase S10 [Bryobacteraceae bacterium]
MRKILGFLLLALGSWQAAPAQTPPPAPAAKEEKKPPQPEEKTSQTKHTLRINGVEVGYTATAGTLLLKKEDGTPRASIFYIAYTRDGVTDLAARPLTFAFNGGPGSSSVWLHLGVLGPKRVLMDPEGNPLPPPYKLGDNEYSLLDATDLVFLDPVSTGYSRAVDEKNAKDFHGIAEDTKSVAEFIRLYTTRHARWTSPKFLAGESYGTTRAAALSGYLQEQVGLNLNGIMLISCVLNFGTLSFDPGNDLPYILYLPSYTATAWYHKKLPKDLQADRHKALEEAQQFARNEYTLALFKGDRLSGEERRQAVEKLARYTGLSPKYIEESNLRVPIHRFIKELLRGERRTVGRFDSRMEGIDANAAGATPDYDPSYAVVQGPYTATWNEYVRSDLKFESDLPYEILTGRVQPWNWGDFQNRYVNVAETLRRAMTENRYLKVFVANGYYDLATPFLATEYTFDHLGLDASLRDHVSMDFFDAGHMMYIRKESLEKVTRDLRQFLLAASSARGR